MVLISFLMGFWLLSKDSKFEWLVWWVLKKLHYFQQLAHVFYWFLGGFVVLEVKIPSFVWSFWQVLDVCYVMLCESSISGFWLIIHKALLFSKLSWVFRWGIGSWSQDSYFEWFSLVGFWVLLRYGKQQSRTTHWVGYSWLPHSARFGYSQYNGRSEDEVASTKWDPCDIVQLQVLQHLCQACEPADEWHNRVVWS